MKTYLMSAGPWVFPLAILILVIAMLFVRNLFRLFAKSSTPVELQRRSIDAVLFWGAIAAIVGWMGQWSGLLKSAGAVFEAGVVNPAMVMLGLGESLSTSVFGMGLLVVASFLWLGLRIALWARANQN
jgi:hypothetical protein